MIRKISTRKLVATALLCSVAGIATAGHTFPWGGWQPPPPPPRYNAPEIDPASASSALTLLMGGLAVLRSRTRKNKQDKQ